MHVKSPLIHVATIADAQVDGKIEVVVDTAEEFKAKPVSINIFYELGNAGSSWASNTSVRVRGECAYDERGSPLWRKWTKVSSHILYACKYSLEERMTVQNNSSQHTANTEDKVHQTCE